MQQRFIERKSKAKQQQKNKNNENIDFYIAL